MLREHICEGMRSRMTQRDKLGHTFAYSPGRPGTGLAHHSPSLLRQWGLHLLLQHQPSIGVRTALTLVRGCPPDEGIA